MVELAEPPGQEGGEARRFLLELSSCWDFFASYDTPEPILRLEFDDGQKGAAGDLEDVPVALYNCLAHYFELPHTGWLHSVGTVFNTKPGFDMQLAYEGLDGPLIVKFSDSTLLTSALTPTKPAERPPTQWEAGLRAGLVQRRVESIVTLAELAELPAQLDPQDRLVAEALLAALSRLAKTEDPPKGVLREAVRWLGRKVDLFVDEAVKTGGKVAGAVVVGVAGYEIKKHMPELADRIAEFLDIAK